MEVNTTKVEKRAVIGQFEGKCCDSTIFNNNDMKLSRELFEILFESDDYKRAMKNRHYIGYLGHPEDPNCMDFKDACIVMTDCWIDEDGEVFGKFDLVNTPVGQVVKAFIDAGVTFGISIRGAGDVDMEGNVDPECFVFRGFDLVTFPAYDDCVPAFQEVAASKDIHKQVKYKKVCAAVKNNLSKITSCNTLEILQEQFREDSDEFASIASRINELNVCEDDESTAIEDQKLQGMTELYLDSLRVIKELEEQIAELTEEKAMIEVACNRKIASYRKIVANQLSDADSQISRLQKISASDASKLRKESESNKRLEAANRRLTSEISSLKSEKISAASQLEDAKSSNLKYKHKIEANSQAISQKDSAIEELKTRLHETVVANKELQAKTSNLDGSVKELNRRVEAAEHMVMEYQQAYANMYANALGIHLDNVVVTSATTVDELQSMICSGTCTSGMMAEPSFDAEYVGDIIDDESTYSAEMVTL